MKLRKDLPQFNWLCRTFFGNIVLGELFGGAPFYFVMMYQGDFNTPITPLISLEMMAFCATSGFVMGTVTWFLLTRRLLKKIRDDSKHML